MQRKVFHRLMQRLIKSGKLHVIDHLGNKHTYGTADEDPAIVMRLNTPHIVTKLILNPDLALGEGYMNQEITVEGGSIFDLLHILGTNINGKSFSASHQLYLWWLKNFKRWMNRISPKSAKTNVAHHYDLSPRLYDLFLDTDRQYSCAYFRKIDNDLNTAQLDKKRHLASKLRLKPNLKVLDIGSGWGGLALYLAQTADVHVTGLTLSEEQIKYSTQRAIEAGLSDKVQFKLIDYREIDGSFDRIVSVGMFEHVGLPQYKTFFNKIRTLLADDGIALLHSIGSEYNPGTISPWIAKYIFPGGYIPTLSEVLPNIEQQHLHITDIEILHHHYAATLQDWRNRFLSNLEDLPDHLDDRFIRMWEYYLSGCQVGFQKLGLMNFQIQMMKNKQYIPLTRDYMYETEHSL